MRALPTDGDVRAYGHVAHRKQRRCKDPRSSSLYRSLPLAFSWARAIRRIPSRDQSAQAFPVFTALITSPANQNAHVTGKAWDRGYHVHIHGSNLHLSCDNGVAITFHENLARVIRSSLPRNISRACVAPTRENTAGLRD